MINTVTKKFWIWVGIGSLILILSAGGFWIAWHQGYPFRLISHYSAALLWEETETMNECAECHEAASFHRCSTCHDDHGAVEFADLPFFEMITFTGDVPSPGVVTVNQILPYRDHPHTHIPLKDFIAQQGVGEFESVTLYSRDGGFITISQENLSDQALLLPYTDGIRFAAEDLHVSTWLKGLTGMVVVGKERPLLINGQETSIGRLMLGPTRRVTVEPAKVMFVSEEDGALRDAQTAVRVEGAALGDLLPEGPGSGLLVMDSSGESHRVAAEEFQLAVLIPDPSGPTLVFPDQTRSSWIKNVVEIKAE